MSPEKNENRGDFPKVEQQITKSNYPALCHYLQCLLRGHLSVQSQKDATKLHKRADFLENERGTTTNAYGDTL